MALCTFSLWALFTASSPGRTGATFSFRILGGILNGVEPPPFKEANFRLRWSDSTVKEAN
eukprot:651023-Amphidinium_carterae.1